MTAPRERAGALEPCVPDGYPGWPEYALEHASLTMAAVRLAMDTRTVVPAHGAAMLRNAALVEMARLRSSADRAEAMEKENAKLRARLDEAEKRMLADEERRKLTGDALYAEGQVAAVESENARLRALVESAYREGFRDYFNEREAGSQDFTPSISWQRSAAKAASE